jgi:hypothetical protein
MSEMDKVRALIAVAFGVACTIGLWLLGLIMAGAINL